MKAHYEHMILLTRKAHLTESLVALWAELPTRLKQVKIWQKLCKHDQTEVIIRGRLHPPVLWQNFVLYPRECTLPSSHPTLAIRALRFSEHSTSSAFTDPVPEAWLGREFELIFGVPSKVIYLALIKCMSLFLKALQVWMLCPTAPAWYSQVRSGLYQLG